MDLVPIFNYFFPPPTVTQGMKWHPGALKRDVFTHLNLYLQHNCKSDWVLTLTSEQQQEHPAPKQQHTTATLHLPDMFK